MLAQDHLLTRVLEDRRRIGSDEHLALADAHHERARTAAREDQAVGRVGREHAEGEGPAQVAQRAPDGSRQVAFVVVFDQVREDLGIGLAAEAMPGGDQPLAQRRVVLDDAVMHHGDAPRAVEVRMRVGVGRPAVRRPARVPQSRAAAEHLDLEALGQTLELALGFTSGEHALGVDHRDARAVVAPILQAAQRVQNDRDRVAPPNVAYDAAHDL